MSNGDGRGIAILVHGALQAAGFAPIGGTLRQPGYVVAVIKGLDGILPEKVAVSHAPADDDPSGHVHEYARVLQADSTLAGLDIALDTSDAANPSVVVSLKR